MAEVSGFKLKGTVHISVTGEPMEPGWRGRIRLAWAVLRGKEVRPSLVVTNSHLESTFPGPMIELDR